MLLGGGFGRRRILIVLGLAAYVAFTCLVTAGILSDGAHVGDGGVRTRGARSDVGTALSLIFVAPFLIWAAIANWNRN